MDIIIPTPPTHFVEDYDITSTTGLLIPITIDPTLGDVWTEGPLTIDIRIAPRPDSIDPLRVAQEECMKVYTSHILSVSKRLREVKAPTKQEAEEWQKTLQELTNQTIH